VVLTDKLEGGGGDVLEDLPFFMRDLVLLVKFGKMQAVSL
jgi:hypothetical protein